MKINDHVDIKNKKGIVDPNDPNCVGRVVDFDDDYVYITNVNMPFMGTYCNVEIPRTRIVKR